MSKNIKGRNRNGTGSIRERGKNRYEGSIMIGYLPDGHRNMVYVTGCTKREVSDQLLKIRQDANVGVMPNSKVTFSQWASDVMELHSKEIMSSTASSYYNALSHVNTYIGKMELSKIKTSDLKRMFFDLSEAGYSPSMLRICKFLVNMVLKAAAADNLIIRNPADYLPKQKHKKTSEKDVYSYDEIRQLTKLLPHDKIGHSIKLLIATGMRRQELLALEQHHISEDGSTITIDQAISRAKGTPILSSPKTENSKRVIVVPTAARKYAVYLRNSAEGSQYIWHSVKYPDKLISPDYFTKIYKDAIESTGVRYLPPHNCRHTYASTLRSLGADHLVVSALLGHSCADITEHYTHYNLSIFESTVELLSDFF